jgi:hypothetical protein
MNKSDRKMIEHFHGLIQHALLAIVLIRNLSSKFHTEKVYVFRGPS